MRNKFLYRINNLVVCLVGRPCSYVGTMAGHILLSGVLLLCSTHPAWAYIDFGIGSMVVQLFLGGIAGALVIVKFYWARIKEWFGKIVGRDKSGREMPTLPDGGEE